MVDINKKDGSV